MSDWREHGIRIVRSGELDTNTPQTPGMTRAAAITHARTGASKLWAGTVVVQPNAKTGPHHHGELETVLYIVRGRVRMRWGDHLELSGEAEPGDFIYVPPYVPHQEINASRNEICEAVVVRNGQEPIVVNLEVETPEPASAGHPGMPFHPHRGGRAWWSTLRSGGRVAGFGTRILGFLLYTSLAISVFRFPFSLQSGQRSRAVFFPLSSVAAPRGDA